MAPYATKYLLYALETIPYNSKILIVGIGNGTPVINNRNIITNKKLKIVGLDTRSGRINTCKEQIEKYYLDDHVFAHCENIYHWVTNHRFDYIIYSDSYSETYDIYRKIVFSSRFLKNGGKFMVISALFDYYSKFKSILKKN